MHRRKHWNVIVSILPKAVGADVLDSTSRDMLTDQKLNEEETWFELSPQQQIAHNNLQLVNSIVRQDYHSIHASMWTRKYRDASLPQR